MADLQGLDEATLKNKLNQASTYEERAAIRKALRELKASTSSKPASSSTTAGYRRPGGGFQQPAKPSPASSRKFVGSSSGSSKECSSPVTRQKTKPQSQSDSTTSSRTTRSAPSATKELGRPKETVLPAPSSSNASSKTNDSLADGIARSAAKTQSAPENRVRSPVQAEKPAVEAEVQRSPSPTTTDPSTTTNEPVAEQEPPVLEGSTHKTIEVSEEQEVSSCTSVEATSASRDDAAEPCAKTSTVAESASVEAKPEASRSRHQTGDSVSSLSSQLDIDEDEEEEAIERQIQATLNYDERKKLRSKLRQLRKSKQNRSSSSSLLGAPPVDPSSVVTKSVEPPVEKTPPAQRPEEKTVTAPERAKLEEPRVASPATGPQDETDFSQKEEMKEEKPLVKEVEPAKEEDAHETIIKSAICNEEPSDDSAVASQNEDDASSQASRASSATSDSTGTDKRPQWTSSLDETSNKSKDPLSSALSQNEGVSDFRTVLHSSSPLPKRKDKVPVEQRDFRSSLRKSEKKTSKDTTDKGPRQEDFRGHLRRSVKTKDASSAAPRKTGGHQEDFRCVLKKTENSSSEKHPCQTKTTTTQAAENVEKVLTREENKEKKSPPPVRTKSKHLSADSVKEHDSAIEVSPVVEEIPASKPSTEPSSMNGQLTNGSSSSPEKTSTEKLLDPWDPSLTYEQRVEARRLLREAKKKGLAPTSGTPTCPSPTPERESYEERRRRRQEEKRREEEERRKQRQQFTQQLNASSPGSSPTKNYQRSTSGVSQLLEWCRRITSKYENIEMKDFRHSWKDGLAFAALMHNFCPNDIPYDDLSSSTRERNFRLAFEASAKAGLPPMLDVEDMMCVSVPDEKSIITYVATIYKHFT